MDEYIEREFNPCDVCDYKRCSNCILHELAMKFVGHPAADVTPVIYCRNCKHRGTDECPMYYEETVSWQNKELMPEWDVIKHDSTRDDGFCDRGDRKDGE